MGNFQVIFFDLDGTIVNSEQGIIDSVKYSLSFFDIFEENSSILRQIIGPPLETSFTNLFDFSPDQTKQAVLRYRDHYAEKGVHEFSVYEGMKDVISALHQSGIPLAVATSKPTKFAKIMLESADLSDFFQVVVGSGPERDLDKSSVIKNTLTHFEGVDRGDILMVGDRKYDILGAHAHGLHSCAVTYGFGTLEELQATQPGFIIHSPKELLTIL